MSIKDCMSKKTRRSLYRVLDILPDKTVVKLQYYASLGRFPNLKDPKRFTEKLQWYKLNYRTPLMTQCADKYKIRFYLKDKGYGDFSPTLYQVCESFEEIEFDKLPDAFAIKCNNSSGTNVFITDKSKMDMNAVAEEVRSWKKVKTILDIFEGTVPVSVYDAATATYHPQQIGFDVTAFTVNELVLLLGKENVVLK